MLNITSIDNGIVIDHIPAGYGVQLFNYLKLEKANFSVALIMNADSKRCGKKDIIKIANNIDVNIDFLGLINPDITINVIENGKISRKIKLEVPEKVTNVLKCKNPRCITSIEGYIDHVFYLVDPEKRTYRCAYCDDIIIPYNN